MIAETNTETARYLELLEQRIALLHSLAESLTAARLGIASLDLNQLETGITRQEKLCEQIRSLDSQIDGVQRQCAAQLKIAPKNNSVSEKTESADRMRETMQRLAAVQISVKQLNDEHQILLQRSRRTVSALLNSYHSFSMTYCDPASPRSVGERV